MPKLAPHLCQFSGSYRSRRIYECRQFHGVSQQFRHCDILHNHRDYGVIRNTPTPICVCRRQTERVKCYSQALHGQ